MNNVFADVGDVTVGGATFTAGLLAGNGGPTATIALNSSGIAVDAGSSAALLETSVGTDLNGDGDTTDFNVADQRGFQRFPHPFAPDIGAFEVQLPPTAVDDAFAINEDAVLAGNVLADNGNGADFEQGGSVSVRPETLVTANGISVSVAADGDFTYTPPADFSGTDTFDYTIIGGRGGLDTGTVTVTVNPVNDAPAGGDTTITINEDASHTFAAADFGFTDPGDNPADALFNVIVDVPPADGTLTLGGVAVTPGQRIPAGQIGNLVFTPTAGANGAAFASFTFRVQDDGGTANGGIDTDQSPNTITIDVNPVNDAPEGSDNTITIREDGSHTFAATDFGFTDPGDNPADALVNVIIGSPPANGTLTLGGVAVTAGQPIPAGQIGNLVFTPAAGANGAAFASFTFRVQDGGGTANGGVDTDQTPNTITFDVTSVNDAPAGTDNTITVTEGAPHGFAAGDFGFSDPGDNPADSLLEVVITGVPANGTLIFQGNQVVPGQSIAAAAIGDLVYVPPAGILGAGADSFTFQVRDDGGTADGGQNTDPTPATMTIDLVEAPSLQVDTATDLVDAFDGDTSLREALALAQNGDTITFDAGLFLANNDITNNTSIDLGTLSGQLVIDQGVTVAGDVNDDGIADVTIDGQGVTRVFDVQDNVTGVVLDGLVIENGQSAGTPVGGGVRIGTGAEVAVTSTHLIGNTGARAGAIANYGTLTLKNSTLSGNRAIYGGAIYNNGGNLTLANSTIQGNIADGAGGGIYNNGGNLTLVNSTISGNRAVYFGGGILNGFGSVTLANATISGNAANAGGGISSVYGPLTLFNSIVAGNGDNVGAPDIHQTYAAAFAGNATNILGSTIPGAGALGIVLGINNSFGLGDVFADVGQVTLGGITFDAGLLKDNGGQTGTIALNPAGIAVDAGTDGDVPTETGIGPSGVDVDDDGTIEATPVSIDQRDAARITDLPTVPDDPGAVDIGAFEVQPPPPTAIDDAFTTNEETPVSGNVLADSGNGADIDPGGGVLSVIPATLATASGATVELLADGSFTYTPPAGFNGIDRFDYILVGSQGGRDTGTVTITVNPVNDAPAGRDATIAISEDGSHTFAAADFGFSDTGDNPADNLLNVIIDRLPASGALTLGGVAVVPGQAIPAGQIGALVYSPAADVNGAGADSFTFRVQDDGGTANGGADTDATPDTISFDIAPVNDAPEGSDTTITVIEDTPRPFAIADFGFSDANDNPTDALANVIVTTLPAGGTLTLNGAAVTAGQMIPAGQIGNLVYTPAANVNGAGADSFTFQVQDDGGTANGGVDTDQTPNTITIDINPVNDPPVFAGIPAALTALEETATPVGLAGAIVSDVDTGTIAVTVSAGTGTISGVANGNPFSLRAATLISTPAGINTVLATLQYTGAANATGADTLTFTANDGAGGIVTQVVNVAITPVNDAPAGTDATITVNEATPRSFTAADFGFSDPNDNPADALANVIVTTLPAGGTLTLNGVAVIAGQIIPAGQVGNLAYTPAANVNGTGADSFTFQVQDDGGTANGGVDTDQTPNTITIDINPVNDAPAGSDNTIALNEDTPYTFAAADFGFSDAGDNPANTLLNVIVTTTPANGSLALGGAAVTAGQAIPAGQIGTLVYTPATDLNGAGADSFTFQVQDNGGTANGGQDTDATPNTLSFDIAPVNDAPVITMPGPQITDDVTPVVFSAANGNAISISDPDAGNGLLTSTLTATSGTLTPSAGSGASITGSGTATLLITGTLAQTNAALDGLVFTPAGGATGTATLSLTTNDNGNTGAGGALSATASTSVEIASSLASTGTDGRIPSDTTTTDTGTQDGIDQLLQANGPGPNNPFQPGTGPLAPFAPQGGPFIDPIITAGIGGTGAQGRFDPSGLPGTINLDPSSDTGLSGTDNRTADNTPLLTGLGPANTTLSIRSSLGGVLGTVETDENGNWRFTAPVLTDGQHRLIAVPIGEDGTEGTPSVPLLAIIDTIAPAAPSAPVLVDGIDPVRSDDAPTFRGTAEPGARVVLRSATDGIVGETIADENGNWRITSAPLTNGNHSLSVTATDIAGNDSEPSPVLSLQVLPADDTALLFPIRGLPAGTSLFPDAPASGNPVDLAVLLGGFAGRQGGPVAGVEARGAVGFVRQVQTTH